MDQIGQDLSRSLYMSYLFFYSYHVYMHMIHNKFLTLLALRVVFGLVVSFDLEAFFALRAEEACSFW